MKTGAAAVSVIMRLDMRQLTLRLDVATLAHLRDAGKAQNITALTLATMLVAQIAHDNLVVAVIGSGAVLDNDPVQAGKRGVQ